MAQDPSMFPSGANPFGSGQPQSNGASAVPPPPPSDQQIGVRTMQSDMESIKQTGGGSPEPQIMSASEVFGPSAQQNQQTPPAPQASYGAYQYGAPSAPAVGDVAVDVAPKAKSSKTIFVIIGIVVLAIAVGFGVFYLVSSLNQSAPVTQTAAPQNTLPVAAENTATTTPTPMESATPVPTVQPLVHTSLIPSPDSSVVLALAGTDMNAFRAAIASSSKQALLAGTVRDIAFTDASGTALSSDSFLQAFFPSAASSLSPLFEKDFTTWLYGDKSGGSKLGVVFTLNNAATPQQVASVMTLMEGAPVDIPNLFLSQALLPSPPTFKEGLVGGLMVRYLVFSIKNQQVFEYTPAVVNGRNVLIMTTSYNQMVDILKRLAAQPVATPTPSPSVTPAPSATPDATTTPMVSPDAATTTATS